MPVTNSFLISNNCYYNKVNNNFHFKMSSEAKSQITSTEVTVKEKETAYKVPSNKTLVWRLGLELVSIAVVGFMVLLPYLFRGFWFAKPQIRGFFCDDEDIKHPYLPETVRFELF